MVQIQNCRVEWRRGRHDVIGESRFPHLVGVAAARPFLANPALHSTNESEREYLALAWRNIRTLVLKYCSADSYCTQSIDKHVRRARLTLFRGPQRQHINRANTMSAIFDFELQDAGLLQRDESDDDDVIEFGAVRLDFLTRLHPENSDPPNYPLALVSRTITRERF